MRITCDREKLRYAVGLAAHVVPSRSPKPILEHLRLSAEADRLTIEATDLEVAMRIEVAPVGVEEKGTATARARDLDGFVRDFQGAEVRLASSPGDLEVTDGAAVAKLATGDEAEFPTLGFEEPGMSVSIPCGVLHGLLGRTAFAAAKEAGRYAMNGVLVEFESDRLRLVGTDGRRLALAEESVSEGSGEKASAIVPLRGVEQFRRVLETCPDRTKTAAVRLAPRDASLSLEGATVFVRLLEGEFPRYAGVMPKESAHRAEIDRRTLERNLRIASDGTSEESRAVRLSFSPGTLVLTSKAPGRVHSVRCQMDAHYKGATVEIAFNPDYLLDALRAADAEVETVQFEFGDRSSPAKLRLGESFQYVVMPIAVE